MTSSNHEPAGDTRLMDDVEFLDLDADSPAPSDTDAPGMEIVDKKSPSPEKKKPRNSGTGKQHRKKKKSLPGLHVILLFVILLILAIALIRLLIWNKGIRVHIDPTEESSEFDTEANDHIIPLNADDPDYHPANDDGELYILLLGNDVILDGEEKGEGFGDLLYQKTGATKIYNAGIPGSFITCANAEYDPSFRMDGFNLPTLAAYLNTGDDSVILRAKADMGDSFTSRMEQSIDTLGQIDKAKLDTICIFYDSRDFLGQRPPGDTSATEDVAVTNYFGALNYSLQTLQSTYPDARIILMSPHFGHFVDENGKSYSSADELAILGAPQFLYVNRAYFSALGNRVSFVDNYYGTIHEDIADKYLTDNIHLNTAGRELLLDRYLDALNRFNSYIFTPAE